MRLTVDATLSLLQSAGDDPDLYQEWLDLRSSVHDPQSSDGPFSEQFRAKLSLWTASADLADLIDRVSPDPDDWRSAPDSDRVVDPASGEYAWLVDRFSNTFLQDWSDESLEFEYTYSIEGVPPRVIPAELLLERRVSASTLRAELARRFVHGRSDRDTDAVMVLTERALDAIRDGRRDVAQTIFQSARTLDPSDPVLANNHAFCMIPDDPNRALVALSEAGGLGGPTDVLQANIATAHLFLGNAEAAMQTCEDAYLAGMTRGARAWLWSIDPTEHGSTIEVDPAAYLCVIAVQAASAAGDDEAVARWTLRQKEFLA